MRDAPLVACMTRPKIFHIRRVCSAKLFVIGRQLSDPTDQVSELLFHHCDQRDTQYHLDKQARPELL